MVDDHGRLGVFFAHPAHFRQGVHADQRTKSQVVFTCRGEHLAHRFRLEPAFRRLLEHGWLDAEGIAFPGRQPKHLAGRIGAQRVHNCRAGEGAGILGHHIQHVRIVRAVIAHLDQVHPPHPGALHVDEQILRRKGGRVHVFLLLPRGQWIAFGIRCPDVGMGIDVARSIGCGFRGPCKSLLWAEGGSDRGRARDLYETAAADRIRHWGRPRHCVLYGASEDADIGYPTR